MIIPYTCKSGQKGATMKPAKMTKMLGLMMLGKKIRGMTTHHHRNGKLKKRIAYAAIPLAVAGVGGLIAKAALGEHGNVVQTGKEEAARIVRDVTNDIDRVIGDLKEGMHDKTVPQLERQIDSSVRQAKEGLDRIAAETKKRLRAYA